MISSNASSGEEVTPLSQTPVPRATAQDELSADMELAAIEGNVATRRDLSPDHPDVTRKELWGWYMFEFASQPFSTAAIVIYIPLILEDLAWRAGTSNPADPLYPPCADRSMLKPGEQADCMVPFLGFYVPPVSYTLYIASISVLIQVLVFISCGALADYSRWRKTLLLAFSVVSAFTCIGFLTVIKPEWYTVASILTIVANVTFGTAMVFYYAYLPLLADAHPSVRKIKSDIERKLYEFALSHPPQSSPRLPPVPPQFATSSSPDGHDYVQMDTIDLGSPTGSSSLAKEFAKAEAKQRLNEEREAVSNMISTNSFSVSFVGGVLALVMTAGFLYAVDRESGGGGASSYMMQICVAFVGVWWLVFMLAFTLPWLHTRPGPPLPRSEKSYFLYSWKKTFRTFRQAAKLRNTFLFLVSWFLYADGYSTIAGVAVLFGKSVLNMSSSELVLIAVLGPLCAIPGNYFFLFVFNRWLKFTSKRVLLLLLALMALIPLYGVVGFAIPAELPFGIRTVPEMYALGAYYGFLLGALQSFSRVLYAELIPPGMESEFFALYQITDKGSSWLGPLLVAVVTDGLGNIRYGFGVQLLFLVLGMVPLALVNVDKGKADARAFSLNGDEDEVEATEHKHDGQETLEMTERRGVGSGVKEGEDGTIEWREI